MEGGVLIEHSHRLLASLVGIFCIGLVVLVQPHRSRDSKLLRGTYWALALVIFQGLLGGATVKLQISPIVSTLHLATSQIFMGLLLWLVLRSRSSQKIVATPPDAKVFKGLKLAAGVVFVQMLLGASIRHGGAGVACGLGHDAMLLCLDISDNQGTWWPTLAQAKLHMLHRYLGVLSIFTVVFGTLPTLKWAKKNNLRGLKRLALLPHLLVLVQVGLGLLTIATHIGVIAVTLHLVFAALLWFVILGLNYLTTEAYNLKSQ